MSKVSDLIGNMHSDSASRQDKRVLNTPRRPSSITTNLNLRSAPAWMQSRAAALCTPAPVTGRRALRWRYEPCILSLGLTRQYVCVFSEAILALQLEVTRLKKDLREGLVQLPHLAQKMDYLTSKCRRDREERKSNTRSRKHHRSASNRWEPIIQDRWLRIWLNKTHFMSGDIEYNCTGTFNFIYNFASEWSVF